MLMIQWADLHISLRVYYTTICLSCQADYSTVIGVVSSFIIQYYHRPFSELLCFNNIATNTVGTICYMSKIFREIAYNL